MVVTTLSEVGFDLKLLEQKPCGSGSSWFFSFWVRVFPSPQRHFLQRKEELKQEGPVHIQRSNTLPVNVSVGPLRCHSLSTPFPSHVYPITSGTDWVCLESLLGLVVACGKVVTGNLAASRVDLSLPCLRARLFCLSQLITNPNFCYFHLIMEPLHRRSRAHLLSLRVWGKLTVEGRRYHIPQIWVALGVTSASEALFLSPDPVPCCGMKWAGPEHSLGPSEIHNKAIVGTPTAARVELSPPCFAGEPVHVFPSWVEFRFFNLSICPSGPLTRQGGDVYSTQNSDKDAQSWA